MLQIVSYLSHSGNRIMAHDPIHQAYVSAWAYESQLCSDASRQKELGYTADAQAALETVTRGVELATQSATARTLFLLLIASACTSAAFPQSAAAPKPPTGVCLADTFPGTDGGAKVAAALASPNCFIVDATRLVGAQKASASIVLGPKQQLLLGPSEWNLSGSPNIDMQGRGASILGSSTGQTRLINNTSSGSSILVGNILQEVGKLDLEVAATITRTGGAGLEFGDRSNTNVHDLIINVGSYGIWLRNKSNGKFNNIDFGFAAINPRNERAWIQGGPFRTCCIASSQFSNITGNGGQTPLEVAGIVLDAGLDTWEFQNVDFGHIVGTNFTSLVMKDSLNVGLPPEWIRFSNTSFEGSGTGAAINISAARSVVFTNVSTGVSADHSVIIDGPEVDGVTFNAGFILYGNKEAIYIPGSAGSPKTLNFSNLQIADGSLGFPGKYCNMYVGPNVSDVKIIGNSFSPVSKAKTSQQCSLKIAKGVGDHIKVIGNVFTQGGPQAFINESSGSDIVVSDNSGVGFPARHDK